MEVKSQLIDLNRSIIFLGEMEGKIFREKKNLIW